MGGTGAGSPPDRITAASWAARRTRAMRFIDSVNRAMISAWVWIAIALVRALGLPLDVNVIAFEYNVEIFTHSHSDSVSDHGRV